MDGDAVLAIADERDIRGRIYVLRGRQVMLDSDLVEGALEFQQPFPMLVEYLLMMFELLDYRLIALRAEKSLAVRQTVLHVLEKAYERHALTRCQIAFEHGHKHVDALLGECVGEVFDVRAPLISRGIQGHNL